MLSRWLRWLVVAPVVLFVFGAILLSCTSGGTGGPIATPTPGFSLELLTISNGPDPTPTFFPTPTSTNGKTPKPPNSTPSATLTPRAPATATCVPTTAPTGIPSPVQFNVIGTSVVKNTDKVKLIDLTFSPSTLWTSTDSSVLMAPVSGPQGGNYTIETAGCACVLASSAGVSSGFVGVTVVNASADPPVTCGSCSPCPTVVPTSTPTPKKGALEPDASSTPAPPARSAGILMWTFDASSELRGRIAVGADGSTYFITRNGLLHGLDSTGKETIRLAADGSSPAVLPNGTVIAMSSNTELAAIAPAGATLWHLEIGDSAGPLATTDQAIYASVGGDLVSVSTAGTLNWRVNVGPVTTAAITPDGVAVGTARGAMTALAADGSIVWTFQPDGGFSGSVAYADDVVYAGSAAGGVYAIDSRAGNPLWHVNPAHPVTAGPAVAASGTIFAGADSVYGVSADGQLRWQNATLKPGEAGLSVLGGDAVFDAATGDVGAVLSGDGSYVWTSRSFGKITTAATSASGMLYVGTSTGRIFAVR